MASPSTIWNDYEKIGENVWNIFENGLLKVFSYYKKVGKPCYYGLVCPLFISPKPLFA